MKDKEKTKEQLIKELEKLRKQVRGHEKDITEYKIVKETLKKSETKYSNIFNSIKEGIIYITDKGKILDINKAFESILDFSRDEIVGKHVVSIGRQVLSGKMLKTVVPKLLDIMQGKKIKPFEVKYRDKILENSSHYNRKTKCFTAIIRDITERKKAEEKLQESETSYMGLTNSISDVFFAMDKDLRYIYWNKASEKQTGIPAKDAIGKSIYEVFSDIKGTKVPKLFREVLKSKKPGYFINKYQLGGKNYTFEVRAYPSKNGITVLQKDITAQKQAEETLKKTAMEWKRTFDSATDIITLISDEHRFLRVNKAGCESLGKTEKELIGKKCYEVVHRTDEPIKECPCIDAVKNKKEGEVEIELDGRYYFIIASPVVDENKKMSSFVHIIRDITERKKAEKQIKKSLKEKEVLIAEVNHRVRNNLNVLTSMLRMQQRSSDSKEVINALSEYKDRIGTMALLHNHLTKSENLADINMKEFCEQLVDITTTTTTTTTTVKIDDISFPVGIATPCGLIVNELITNSMKYAFNKDSKDNRITVSMTVSKDGTVTLAVGDNGKGLPEGFDIEKDSHTGLNLVKILSERQLQGSYEVKSDKKGTTFKIKFKKDLG